MALGWLKSVGKEIGKDTKSLFAWVTSSKGQAVIAAGEGVAESFGAPAALINAANYWLNKIVTVEGIAFAAGQQDGSGVLKGAAVLSDVTPYVLEIAKQNGLPIPSADSLAKANTALVTFLNVLGGDSATTSAPSAPAPVSASPLPTAAHGEVQTGLQNKPS